MIWFPRRFGLRFVGLALVVGFDLGISSALTCRIDRVGPVHGEHIEGAIGDAVDAEDYSLVIKRRGAQYRFVVCDGCESLLLILAHRSCWNVQCLLKTRAQHP